MPFAPFFIARWSSTEGTRLRKDWGSKGIWPCCLRPCLQCGRDVAEQRGVRTSGAEGDAHAACRFDDAGADLDERQAQRIELSFGQRFGFGDGVPHREHKPVGGGVQDQPHLIGSGRAAGGAVAFELGFVQLDEVLGLPALAVELCIKPFRGTGFDAGHHVTDVQFQRRRLDAGGDAAFDGP